MLEITPWHERFLVVGLSKVWLQWKDFWIPFAYFLPTKYRKDANQNGSAESAQGDEMISNAQLACTQLRVIPEFNGQPVFFYLPVWETIRIATFSPGQRPPQMTMAEQDIASCAKNVGLWMGVVIFCRMTACWSLLQFEFVGASLCMKQCWRQYRLMPSTHTPETSGRCLPFPPC